MPTISVHLHARRQTGYDIAIKPGLFDELPELIGRFAGRQEAFVITDEHVQRLYGKKLLQSVEKKGMRASFFVVPAGEQSKNSDLVNALHTELLQKGIQRASVIVAFGGGVVGDLAGYVAATILRGVPFIQVPTSLLSQVDSSVGGKVGIDHPLGKNLIGAFFQPVAVAIDPRLLLTLPDRQFRSGLGEIVKIAAALDRTFFLSVDRVAQKISKSKAEVLTRVITTAVGLKASVVQLDEYETGLRKCLNLGHTLGHAIEAATGYRLTHGEAVAIGLALESQLAVWMGLMDEKERKILERTIVRLKLPTKAPAKIDRAVFVSALKSDKKSIGGKVQFVLPAGIGRCAIGVDVPEHLIDRVMRSSR